MIVVIPAYEPDEKLLTTVEQISRETDYSIIVVNDGSSKEYGSLFAHVETYATVLHHDENRGKGRALKTAFEYIKNGGYSPFEGIVTVDADGQHLLKDIVRVSNAFFENPRALVLGSRAFKGKVPLRSRLGNGITRFVFAVTTGVRVYDTQTGLRAFSVSRIDDMLEIKGERYEYEINQLLTCTKKQIKIIEVEIETVYIDENKTSHFNTFRDSWRIYKSIFAFIGSSLFCWAVDYSLLLLLNLIFSRATDGSGFELFGYVLEPKLTAIVIARAVSSAINYFLNRKIVFESKAKGSLIRYYILVAAMLVVNYLLLNPMTGAGMPLAVAQLIAQLIIYPVNYVLQRRFVFNDGAKKE